MSKQFILYVHDGRVQLPVAPSRETVVKHFARDCTLAFNTTVRSLTLAYKQVDQAAVQLSPIEGNLFYLCCCYYPEHAPLQELVLLLRSTAIDLDLLYQQHRYALHGQRQSSPLPPAPSRERESWSSLARHVTSLNRKLSELQEGIQIVKFGERGYQLFCYDPAQGTPDIQEAEGV